MNINIQGGKEIEEATVNKEYTIRGSSNYNTALSENNQPAEVTLDVYEEEEPQPEIIVANNDDSLFVEMTDEEVSAALSAEKKAKAGLILTIIGGILLFGIFTTLLGFLIMFIGLIFSICSLVSTYNTREGRRKAWASMILFFVFPILASGLIIISFLLFF